MENALQSVPHLPTLKKGSSVPFNFRRRPHWRRCTILASLLPSGRILNWRGHGGGDDDDSARTVRQGLYGLLRFLPAQVPMSAYAFAENVSGVGV